MQNNTIIWTGDNLREVIEFTGLHPMFNEWFKSWEEYEEYVRTHDNIFRLYLQDCISYYLIQPGCIIERNDERVTNQCYPITEGKFELRKMIQLKL